jgi:hypothetical protein
MGTGSAIDRIKKVSGELRERIARLSSSERDVRAIRIGAAGICLIIIYVIFHSITSGTERLEKQVRQLETELGRIENLRTEYEGSKQRMTELSSKIKEEREPLISVVEKILLEENIDRKNFSIKDVNLRTTDSEDFYEEKSIDVELKDLSLKDLIDILYKIQNTKSFLKVSNLNISTKFNKSDSMTVKLRVSTFEFRELG